MGYREDIGELCAVSDVFVFPSYREGLSVSLMEALASGLPCVVGKIRGNTDLIDEIGGFLFNPHCVDECKKAIENILKADGGVMRVHNMEKIKLFGLDTVNKMMNKIYKFMETGDNHENNSRS